MKEVYPIVKDRFRFLAGGFDTPRQLWELSVSGSYHITQSGKNEYLIRGASKLIMINKQQLDKYFEPFVDYFAEPLLIDDAGNEVSKEIVREEEVNCVRIAHSNTENYDMEQLSLF